MIGSRDDRGRGVVAVVAALVLVASAVVLPGQEAARAASVLMVPGQFPTIQSAIAAATDGDTVQVSEGTYHGSIDFAGKDITLEGRSYPVLDFDAGPGVHIGPDGTLNAFILTNASDELGAALKVTGDGSVISENHFNENTQADGGSGAAIYGNGSSPTIDSNVFRGNACDDQSAAGVVVFANDSAPILHNNAFLHNGCRALNLHLPADTTPVVVNNLFFDNPVGVEVGGQVDASGQAYRNNIVVNNGVGVRVDGPGPDPGPTWDHNLVFGNTTDYSGLADPTGTSGNLSADPRFVDETEFNLRIDSPAIDSGTATDAPARDFLHVGRPIDGNFDGVAVVDMGIWERVDWPPLPVMTIGSTSVVEGAAGHRSVHVPVHLSTASDGLVTAHWSTASGTAKSPGDFTAASGTVAFAPGETDQNITVAVNGDRLDEPDESLLVTLSAPAYARLGAAASAPITITDDDDRPTITPVAASAKEGNREVHALVFPVRLSAPSGRAISIRYRTVGGSARPGNDYVSKQGIVRFDPGETVESITVWAKGDRRVEPSEVFTVGFFTVVNARIAPTRIHVPGHIVNDD